MDHAARRRIIAETRAQQSRGDEVAVSLELFFIGNDDPGSIGCNLGLDQPPVETFRDVLIRLRARAEVQDFVVRIADADDDTSWPFTAPCTSSRHCRRRSWRRRCPACDTMRFSRAGCTASHLPLPRR